MANIVSSARISVGRAIYDGNGSIVPILFKGEGIGGIDISLRQKGSIEVIGVEGMDIGEGTIMEVKKGSGMIKGGEMRGAGRLMGIRVKGGGEVEIEDVKVNDVEGNPVPLEVGNGKVAVRSGIRETRLYQNYPNPFRSPTVIEYDIGGAGHVKLKVYNIFGQEIKVLVDEEQASGSYRVV